MPQKKKTGNKEYPKRKTGNKECRIRKGMRMVLKNLGNDRTAYQGTHILAGNVTVETDSWKTRRNNNVLLFGTSGSGKTREYVRPNIEQAYESIVVSDTKGTLYNELGPELREKGYDVRKIDFTDLTDGSGYNPFDYIRYNPETDSYQERDILSLSECFVSSWSDKDPYWDHAARQYLSMLICYVLEALPKEEHTFESVLQLLPLIGEPEFDQLFRELEACRPDSTAALRYRSLRKITVAEKMHSSIIGVLSTNLDSLAFDEALALYRKPDRIDFKDLGRKKMAIFLTVSDMDRSLDKLATCFVMQALQILTRSADQDYPDDRLPIPVRFYLDDFATNIEIPDFDKIVSVIRSREIYVSIILQSITQLDSIYGSAKAKTILNNCDQLIYLGGQDLDTARLVSEKTNRPLARILGMDLNEAYVFIRGMEPQLVKR